VRSTSRLVKHINIIKKVLIRSINLNFGVSPIKLINLIVIHLLALFLALKISLI
jgi:hypothetical protein